METQRPPASPAPRHPRCNTMTGTMAAALDQLVEKLRRALDTDLVSVVLYGSAATGDHNTKFSDYNVLCVLTQIAPKHLRATEPLFRWWREQGNPAPLLLTEDELRTSTDCFPIEFHDIRDHHKILIGADGEALAAFGPRTDPLDASITEAVEKAL